jgi:uncharacterized lipoprotein YehR (DUF1307 family)
MQDILLTPLERLAMTKIATASLAAMCIFGLTACGDNTVNKTTSVKEETKIDEDGHERTRTETKTVEVQDRNGDGTATHDRKVDDRKDQIIKVGPLEIRKE